VSVRILTNVLSCIIAISTINASGLPSASAADIGVSDKVTESFKGYDGTFVMRDAAGKTVIQYNDALAKTRLSPCSTFKIVIGLVGLETGAIKDENTTEKWEGEKQSIGVWDKDHNLKTAMDESVNWYFQKVSARIGQAEMAKYLKLFHYGNEDISSGSNCWMGSEYSLRISPEEQVDFLERLYAEKLPLSARSQQIIKRILKVDESPVATLYGKTGTDQKDGKMVSGWFVGFVESKKGNYVFATYIHGVNNVLGRKAREITKQVLATRGDW
jgi:bla regulator protein BlaR1